MNKNILEELLAEYIIVNAEEQLDKDITLNYLNTLTEQELVTKTTQVYPEILNNSLLYDNLQDDVLDVEETVEE